MRKELTVRGLIIGILITLVFTAANVYFGLKAGLTFSTSIPAAVISMAILRGFRDATIQENNIVQTVASAAGTLSSIIFVLPGLIMIGWWTEFPFWISFWICALGGILGVMYSIPLRRALVTTSDLPYPEGVACAEVLKIGSSRLPTLNMGGPVCLQYCGARSLPRYSRSSFKRKYWPPTWRKLFGLAGAEQ
jgi:putative OPT family oligopeptide transporter